MRALLIAAFLVATNAAAECDWYCEQALLENARETRLLRQQMEADAMQARSEQFGREMDESRAARERYEADLQQWRKNGMPMGQMPDLADY